MALLSISGVGMLVMAGFLALAAVAQYNDPDPVVWIAAYALPSALTVWACVTTIGSCLWKLMCTVVLVGTVIFASKIMYPFVIKGNLEHFIASEEGRESAGLAIVILWLLLLLVFPKGQRGSCLDHGLLMFAVVPPSIWVAYKLYIQSQLSLPDHCEGLI